jgi:hypothetical protein
LDLRDREKQEAGENRIMDRFMIYSSPYYYYCYKSEGECDGREHVTRIGEVRSVYGVLVGKA